MSFVLLSPQYFWCPSYLLSKKICIHILSPNIVYFLESYKAQLKALSFVSRASKVLYIYSSIDQSINILTSCLGVCLPWDIICPYCEKWNMSSPSLLPLVFSTEFNYSDCFMSAGWNHSHIQLGRHHMASWDLVLAVNTWHTPAKYAITAYFGRIRTVIQTYSTLKSLIFCKFGLKMRFETLPWMETTPYLVS